MWPSRLLFPEGSCQGSHTYLSYLVQSIHKDLEAKLARFHRREDTILYPSCFDANAGLFEVCGEMGRVAGLWKAWGWVGGMRVPCSRACFFWRSKLGQLAAAGEIPGLTRSSASRTSKGSLSSAGRLRPGTHQAWGHLSSSPETLGTQLETEVPWPPCSENHPSTSWWLAIPVPPPSRPC